jgi:threonine aldolase
MSPKIIDLRSDTVTLPTDEMRQAMATAECGDDVFGEDPTLNALEVQAAEITGKAAAVFVPSGTMANLVCVMTHCGRGDEVILGDVSHIFLNEAGGIAGCGGIHPHTVSNQPDGTMLLGDIEQAIRGDDVHWPRTKLLCLENTHNRCYGAPLSIEYVESAAALARQHGLAVHCDGARIFNAAVALGTRVAELVKPVDSVMFCLSKGLAAPIGSLVCGSRAFIAEARRIRKMLGGGMRQVGVIAAPGKVALDTMVERLKEDHENARLLAQGLAEVPGLSIEKERVCTNILYFDLEDEALQPDILINNLETKGVKILQTGARRFRCVTHHGITREDVQAALAVFQEVATSHVG